MVPNMAEYALPKRPADLRYKLLDAVCAFCGFNEVIAQGEAVVCASCFSTICVLCGCVDDISCRDGCSWMLPGVCSTHDGDVRMSKLVVPGAPISALEFTN